MPATRFLSVFLTILVSTCVNAENIARRDFKASISPSGTKIVFYSYVGESMADIYMYDLEAGIEKQLTITPDLMEIEPVWMPDNEHVLYSVGPSMKSLSIGKLHVESSRFEVFYEGEHMGPAKISRDGRFLAFWSLPNSGADFLIFDRETGASESIKTGLDGHHSNLNWFPDGSVIFTVKDDSPGAVPSLIRIYLASRATDKIADFPRDAFNPEVSPDGMLVIFNMQDADGILQIYCIPAAGGVATPVSRSEDGMAYFPTFSPDGNWIYYSQPSNQDNIDIFRVPTNRPTATRQLVFDNVRVPVK
jgi:Tol biopolymer transport system component